MSFSQSILTKTMIDVGEGRHPAGHIPLTGGGRTPRRTLIEYVNSEQVTTTTAEALAKMERQLADWL